MFVVAGVSGHTGKVVAAGLLAAGKKVRVLVRDPKKGESWKAKGAEVAVADMADAASLTKALAGAEAAYLLLTYPSPVGFKANQRKVADAITAAVAESKLPRLVLLSSIGADVGPPTGPIEAVHYLEGKLSALPTKSVFLRPCSFMENQERAVGSAKEQGAFYSVGDPSVQVEHIATKDIGDFAVEALLKPPAATEVRQLAGPKTYSNNDIAETFGRALKKSINVVHIPLEQAGGALKGAGLPPEIADAFQEMFTSFFNGHIKFDPKLPILRGPTPLTSVIQEISK
jgi:uncharacterized protein YbjT (DUF2867 family)